MPHAPSPDDYSDDLPAELLRGDVKKAQGLSFRQKEKLQYALLLIPGCLLYGIFNLLPLIGTLVLSFFDWPGIGPATFVGFDNFTKLLADEYMSNQLWNAFQQTFVFFAICISLFLGLGTTFALLLSWNTAGKSAYKLLFFMPYPLAAVAVAFLGQLIVDVRGPLNQLMMHWDLISSPLMFLGEADTALPTIALFQSWQKLGFSIMLILSAILGVRADLLEAAVLDGANRWQCIRHVVFPVLAPAFVLITILTMVDVFNNAEYVLILMGPDAGPYYSTDILGTFQYRTAFGTSGGSGTADLGMAAAIGMVISVLILPATIYLALRNMRNR
ncbi:sugar ABC transporter permease [Photobacterium sp. WH77]|uniref:carbohydrate ABC transporter permease n=1 Tax=Photobacterium TaxID=657 RepID=UPI001C4707F0|nr:MULTISPECIES: sugar ABC transporter permease [Photobacterium]MBV7264269.1 sugar ABC transporter permease [Photobacterium sp. WH24]MCG2838171.1 sugar ABC transporter permease [Photobacterium sp. WH77]MCG2845789.1 sugar ABC transporter permease [Photobacterium sp. WH80]MDO6581498.1 sugar ABC transporter permease [Photobacterium sp. 2_MG-2023]